MFNILARKDTDPDNLLIRSHKTGYESESEGDREYLYRQQAKHLKYTAKKSNEKPQKN